MCWQLNGRSSSFALPRDTPQASLPVRRRQQPLLCVLSGRQGRAARALPTTHWLGEGSKDTQMRHTRPIKVVRVWAVGLRQG